MHGSRMTRWLLGLLLVSGLVSGLVAGSSGCASDRGIVRDVAAKALDCKRWEITLRSFDDDEAMAECREQGVLLQRAGEQWLVISTYPIAAAIVAE